MQHEMIARRDAAQAALERFDGCAFKWSTNDCARLAAFTLRHLGYQPTMPKAGSYASEQAALRALLRAGYRSMEEALDAMVLPRIPPAAAIVGDIVGLPGVGGWTALFVALGNGRVLGFKDGRCGVMQPLEMVTAWRAAPCLKR